MICSYEGRAYGDTPWKRTPQQTEVEKNIVFLPAEHIMAVQYCTVLCNVAVP